jgi:hypothetical protein
MLAVILVGAVVVIAISAFRSRRTMADVSWYLTPQWEQDRLIEQRHEQARYRAGLWRFLLAIIGAGALAAWLMLPNPS